MADYRKKLIRYMREKDKLSGGLLFNENDEAALLAWPNQIAHYVWNRLVDNIYLLNYKNICEEVCPFCIRYLDMPRKGRCMQCAWGQHHGRCGLKTSYLNKVANDSQFTNKFFRSIIRNAAKQ
jgi:hypothetical protein